MSKMIAFVKNNGGLDYTVTKMKAFQAEALQILQQFPDSSYKSSIELMVNYVIERKK